VKIDPPFAIWHGEQLTPGQGTNPINCQGGPRNKENQGTHETKRIGRNTFVCRDDGSWAPAQSGSSDNKRVFGRTKQLSLETDRKFGGGTPTAVVMHPSQVQLGQTGKGKSRHTPSNWARARSSSPGHDSTCKTTAGSKFTKTRAHRASHLVEKFQTARRRLALRSCKPSLLTLSPITAGHLSTMKKLPQRKGETRKGANAHQETET
jgi:hypothetical protein